MEIHNDRIILRDFIETDIANRIYWETVETEWQQWDAPWEYEDEENFDPEKFCARKLEWLEKPKDDDRVRWRLEICINDTDRTNIGWVSAYNINEKYEYTNVEGMCAIGIDMPSMSARHQGYGTVALTLYINYLMSKGIKEFYTQTWSGNKRMIGLARKLGFEECNRNEGIHRVRCETYDALTFKLNLDNCPK